MTVKDNQKSVLEALSSPEHQKLLAPPRLADPAPPPEQGRIAGGYRTDLISLFIVGTINPWNTNGTKRQANSAKHGGDFSLAEGFNWETTIDVEDERKNYGELRRVAMGLIGSRLYVMIYTSRSQICRIISLRKANARERKYFENETKTRSH